MSGAVIAALNCWSLTKVVVRSLPFQYTTAPLTKLVPVTVSVMAAPPATALVGEIEASVGTLALAVKLKLAGVETPGTEAVTVMVPGVLPSVAVTCVWPLLSVAAGVLSVAPPAGLTAKVTVTPETGLLNWSVTFTTSGWDKGAPTVSVCGLPDTAAIAAGALAVAVKLKLAGGETPGTEAVTVMVPGVLPSVAVTCV
jgi:hypothetical protein